MTWNFHQELKCFSSPVLSVNFLKCGEQRNDSDVIARSHSALMSEHQPRQSSDALARPAPAPRRGSKPATAFFLPFEWSELSWQDWNPTGAKSRPLGLWWKRGWARLRKTRDQNHCPHLTAFVFHDQPDKNHLKWNTPSRHKKKFSLTNVVISPLTLRHR